MFSVRFFFLAQLAFVLAIPSTAQSPAISEAVAQADPTARVQQPVLESSVHKPLPEQFIWRAMPAGTPNKVDEATPRFYRTTFDLTNVPQEATLYVSGPDHVRAFLNGGNVATADRDPNAKTYPLVVVVDVAKELKSGRNVIAVEGKGGSPLALKIVPAAEEVDAAAILISGPGWKASLREQAGWERPEFDDSAWENAKALGSIDTRVDGYRHWYVMTSNLEWNSDSEMYRWPGYDGISPYLAHLPIMPAAVSDVVEAGKSFENIGSLTNANPSAEFKVQAPNMPAGMGGIAPPHPSLVLDFGRETNGRLEVVSDSPLPVVIWLQYGESWEEAMKSPYLGMNELLVPPHATVYGPKSAFRYVKLEFWSPTLPSGAQALKWVQLKSIRVDAIYYPVRYAGSFESSDAMLNRIWAVGAYTAHLCMQDAIWDAPKRDRMPWMGDLDVSGEVINDVFADRFLMQNTMDRLIDEAGNPLARDVNGIPGYSAFWVMGEADYYRHIGDKNYLMSLHDRLIRLLDYMEGGLNDQNYFANTRKAWPFVDWSPELEKDTPEARSATQFEFYKAFSEGAWLLDEMGDAAASKKYRAEADELRNAAQNTALDPGTYTFGERWQPNAMAVYAGVANAKEAAAIWERVLSLPPKSMISPYYNFYAITAMAEAGHRREALDWIRKYWGGMINEGATSFWEGYDPSWPKQDFHAHLNADDEEGYRTSLAHGWSSGATAWLTEQILGIQPTAAGFREATIRPDLAGLQWARGTVPTPQGPIRVDYKTEGGALDAQIDLPAGITARVQMPLCLGHSTIRVAGGPVSSQNLEPGGRVAVTLEHGGHYTLDSECAEAPPEP